MALRFPVLSETFILNHITGLLDAGHDVRVLSLYHPVDALLHEDVGRYHLLERTRYLDVPARADRLARLRAALSRLTWKEILHSLDPSQGAAALTLKPLFVQAALLPAESIDVIHCHFGVVGYACLALRERFAAPLVTSFHGFDLTVFGPLTPFAYSRLFEAGDAFVANSRHTAASLCRLGCPIEKIHVIPAVLDDRGIVPRHALFESGPVQLLTVARLIRQKGVQDALRAVCCLRDNGYDLRYTVVGDGIYRSELERMARALRIDHIVSFTGALSRDDVYSHYSVADVFVLPSVGGRWGAVEAQGLVVQEAQLHRLPVVVSRSGGLPEVVSEGETGLLFEPGDWAGLARQIRRLADDHSLAERVAEAGMHQAHASTKAELLLRTEDLYRSLLKKVPHSSLRRRPPAAGTET